MGVDEQSCGVGSDDDSLRAICDDSWALNAVTDGEIFEFVNRGLLSSTLEVDRFRAVDLLALRNILGRDVFELLIDGLLKPFEGLSNATNSDIINNDIAVWQSETKLLLMLLDKRLAKRPRVSTELVLRLFVRGLQDHERRLGTAVAHVEVVFEVQLAIPEALLLQRSAGLLHKLQHLVLQGLP